MIAYAKASPVLSVSRQTESSESVQALAVDEYRTAIRGMFKAVPHGARIPRLVSLDKHIGTGENKVAETTVAMAFGSLRLGADIDLVTRPFRLMESMLRAQLPAPTRTIAELMQVETQIDSVTDCLQMKFMADRHSGKTKAEMLESFEEVHKISGEIVAQLRKELYSGPRG